MGGLPDVRRTLFNHFCFVLTSNIPNSVEVFTCHLVAVCHVIYVKTHPYPSWSSVLRCSSRSRSRRIGEPPHLGQRLPSYFRRILLTLILRREIRKIAVL